MKKGRIILTVLLSGLIAVAWILQVESLLKEVHSKEYYLEAAGKCMERCLYEKAAQNYAKVLEIEESVEHRDALINAMELAYEEQSISKPEYITVLEQGCSMQPQNTEYWEKLLSTHIQAGDYLSAYKCLRKANNQGVLSKRIEALSTEILYSYTITQQNFSEVLYSPNGYYTVYDDAHWGVVNVDGEWLYPCEYKYISPLGNERVALITTERGTRVYNYQGVAQAIIDDVVICAKACGNGMLPVQVGEEEWKFYKYNEDKYDKKNYENVTSYTDEKAAVYDNGWKIVDLSGKVINDKKFEDIKLFPNGNYCYEDVMIASAKDGYKIYNAEGKALSKKSVKDADVYLGGYIAFQNEDGEWGYMNKKGEVMIQPRFKEAKSFSNGLAAVSNGQAWGYINEQGEVVVDFQYLDAQYFTNQGVSFVSSYEGSYYQIKMRFF